jgi:multisubunit Na+/H+ antiporter MnhC subunit
MFLIDLMLLSKARKVRINNQEKVKRILIIRSIVRLFCLLLFALIYFTLKQDLKKYKISMMIVSTLYICFHLTVSRLISRYMYKDPEILFDGDNHEIFNVQTFISLTNIIIDIILSVVYISFMIDSYYRIKLDGGTISEIKPESIKTDLSP